MKRKILYFALVIMLITSFAVLTGCGDMSKLAGSVSSVMEEESSEDAEETVIDQTEEQSDDLESTTAEDMVDEQSKETGEEQSEEEQLGDVEEEQHEDVNTITVVLNTNKERLRIHMPGTSCSEKIKEENYLEWTGTSDELINYANEHGYVACGTCHPERKLGIDLPTNKKK